MENGEASIRNTNIDASKLGIPTLVSSTYTLIRHPARLEAGVTVTVSVRFSGRVVD